MDYVERMNILNGGSASALYVIQHDSIVAENYNGSHTFKEGAQPTAVDSQFNVGSIRKSYIGFAVSYALHTGVIASFDDPVSRYISLSNEDKELLNKVTIRHLLTHTHGLERDKKNGQLVRRFEPGMGWAYNNVGIKMLTESIIPHVTGITVGELLEKNVFRPLQWTETGWRTNQNDALVPTISDDHGTVDTTLGKSTDGSEANLFVSARELAFWGYLHLKSGRIASTQVVPEAVIKTAVSVQSPHRLPKGLPRNSCLWLVKQGESPESLIGSDVPEGSFKIVGLTGPIVLVVPKLELVVVRMANRIGNYEDERGTYIDYIKEFSDLAVKAAKEM